MSSSAWAGQSVLSWLIIIIIFGYNTIFYKHYNILLYLWIFIWKIWVISIQSTNITENIETRFNSPQFTVHRWFRRDSSSFVDNKYHVLSILDIDTLNKYVKNRKFYLQSRSKTIIQDCACGVFPNDCWRVSLHGLCSEYLSTFWTFPPVIYAIF